MTANQIAYAKLLEDRRHNAEQETEARRSNLAREAENLRSNKANEALTKERNAQSYETGLIQAKASASQADTAKYRAENDPKTAITDGIQSAIGKAGDIGQKIRDGKADEVVSEISSNINKTVSGMLNLDRKTDIIGSVVSEYVKGYDITKPWKTVGAPGLVTAIYNAVRNRIREDTHSQHNTGAETITGHGGSGTH